VAEAYRRLGLLVEFIAVKNAGPTRQAGDAPVSPSVDFIHQRTIEFSDAIWFPEAEQQSSWRILVRRKREERRSNEAQTCTCFFCVLGAVLPYSQFVPWVMETGCNSACSWVNSSPTASAPSSGWMSSCRPQCSWCLCASKDGCSACGAAGFRLPLFAQWELAWRCVVLYLRERALEGLPGAVEAVPPVRS